MAEPIRIANCSGYFGDRPTAAREMVEDGPIDVLTGDWLAELTMLILARARMKRPGGGYARDYVHAIARQEDGEFIIDGEKSFALGAHAADTLIVSARLGSQAGPLGLFLVPRVGAGVRPRESLECVSTGSINLA